MRAELDTATTTRFPVTESRQTDFGTFVIHWVAAIAMIASLVTGFRLAVDDPNVTFAKWFAPVLPQGEVWTVHFIAGLALFFALTAYVVYLARTGLARRNMLRRINALFMPTAGKMRWAAVNVLLHWFLYALVLVMTATGIALYIGFGGWVVRVHYLASVAAFAYIFVHTVTHFLYGGWRQLLRIFWPAKLEAGPDVRPRPVLLATAAGVLAAAVVAYLDFGTRADLHIPKVTEAPKMDGLLDDAVWKSAEPVTVRTQQGVGLGGTGESTVEMKAVRDGERVYFAFRWEDPTRSMRRVPMVKKADGWHLLDTRADIADVVDFYEDKFAILFSTSDGFGGGGTTHMGERPLGDKPAPFHARGYHYTTDGSYADMWQWKASRGGHLGQLDDQYFGPPRTPTEAEAAGKARYQAGYWNDPGKAFYSYNYKGEPPGGYKGPVGVNRLPKDHVAMTAALKTYDLDPESNDSEGSIWWMTEAETVPYSPELDAAIPVGTVMPGVLIMGSYEGDRAQVTGAAKYADGYWTLEATRILKTGSTYDQDFVEGRDLYAWVSVFDHNQTRHTRHVRPVKIILD